MPETIKNGDFVELDYTGILKEADLIFDTTIESVAKENGIFDPKMSYATVSICVGQGQILPGLDKHLEGLEVGKESEVTLKPEEAFGKKDGKLMKLVPTSAFKRQNINPVVGLQVNIDGAMGTIRTVTGGRTVVDFNHPFASKEITYKVNIKRIISDEKDKVAALCELALNQKKDAIDIDIKDGKALIKLKKDFHEQLLELVKQRITTILPTIKEVEFRTPTLAKKPEAEEKKAETKAEAKPAEPKKEEPAQPEPKKD